MGDVEGIVEVEAGGGVEVWSGAWGGVGAGCGGAARPSSVSAMEMGLLGVDSTRSPIRDAASDRLACRYAYSSSRLSSSWAGQEGQHRRGTALVTEKR